MRRLIAVLVLLVSAAPLSAQWLSLPSPGIPRTADGRPDLSAPVPRSAAGRPQLEGLWRLRTISGDLFDESKLKDSTRALIREREHSFFVEEPGTQCLPRGPGHLSVGDQLRRIVEGSTVIAVLHEDLTHRQIFIDGRTLEPNASPTWTGYSVGRWDGDTLVVESNGFNDKTWLHNKGLPHTEALRVTERYRRLDFGHLRLDVVYDDPGAFEAPLEASFAMELAADDQLLEVVCAEASEGLSHWVGKTTDAEASVVSVAPDILAEYVGMYRGYWGNTRVTVQVTLEDGVLLLARATGRNNAAEKFRLLAQSDTAFDCSCGLGYIFTRGRGASAPEVAEVHVSGAWTFARVPP
jgi:hypothetical protein